jgi:hypothetical protein
VDRIGLWGLAATLIGVSATLRPVNVPDSVAAAVFAVGVALLMYALLAALRALALRKARSRQSTRRAQCATVAGHCWQVNAAVSSLLQRRAPTPRLRAISGRGRSRPEVTWERDIVSQYRADLADWALSVFDEAVVCGAAAPGARRIVEGRTASQITMLPELFAEAARTLHRASRESGSES